MITPMIITVTAVAIAAIASISLYSSLNFITLFLWPRRISDQYPGVQTLPLSF